MPDEPSASLPGTPQSPRLPANRAPVPGWTWALFGLGLVPVGALVCMAVARPPASQLGTVGLFGAVCGLVLGLPMVGGLALATRFFHEAGTRILMGLVFALVITVALAGVLFAGCMCLFGK